MAKESIPLGLKYSCMLKDTAENDVLQEGGLREWGTLKGGEAK